MAGGRGKVVRLPTFESDKQIKTHVNKEASDLRVAIDGKVTPQIEDVLKIFTRENLLLATGHVHAEEIAAITKRVRKLCVRSILVPDGLTNIPGLSMAQNKEVVAMGPIVEMCFLQFMTGPDA